MIRASFFIFPFVLLISFFSLADESYYLKLVDENESNVTVFIYNETDVSVKLKHALCFSPHKGVAFTIENEEGHVYEQTSTLNSGCSLSEDVYVDSNHILGRFFEKGLLRFIYHLPYEHLYVKAYMCDNFFIKENCFESNKLLIDFNKSFK
jgi:hypothetical protein